MLNNDLLRRLRYVFGYNDIEMINIFKLGDLEVSRDVLVNWLKKKKMKDFRAYMI